MAEDNDSANKDKPAMAEDPNTLHVLNQQRNWDTLRSSSSGATNRCATTPSRSAISSTR